MNNKYPVFNEGTIARISPDKVTLIPSRDIFIPISHSNWEVFKLCDGSKSINDIIKYISVKWEIEKKRFLALYKMPKIKGTLS